MAISSLNEFPNEILELFLCDTNKDWHYILMQVCRRWYGVIQRWRLRQKNYVKVTTSLACCAISNSMFNWVHKESFHSNFDYYTMLKQVALAGNSELFIEKITKIPDMQRKFYREISKLNARADFQTMFRDTTSRNIPLINYVGWGGNLEIIKWYLNLDVYPCTKIIYQIVVWSVEKGNLDVFKWHEDHSSHFIAYQSRLAPLVKSVLSAATENGYIDIFEYIYSHYIEYINGTQCLTIAAGSAENGHLAMVKRLYNLAFPPIETQQMFTIIQKGQVHVLDWLYSNHYDSIDWVKIRLLVNAVNYGHLEVLKWGLSKRFVFDAYISHVAALKGYDEIVKWLYEIECPFDERVMDMFARNNKVDMIYWGHEIGLPFDEDVCIETVRSGNLPLLKWLRERNYPWNEIVCELAAEYGHYQILQWAHENGCEWDDCTCAVAIQQGDLKIFKYAVENGCPHDYDDVYVQAQQNCQYEILQYLHDMRYQGTDVTLFDVS